MFRRLLVSLVLAALPAFAGAPQQALKIATIAPDGSSWMVEMRAASAEIEKRTAGRVAFKFYPGGVMGNDTSVLRKIRIGQLHGAAFPLGSLGEVYPDSRIWGLPMLFRSEAEVDHVRQEFDQVFTDGLDAAGFVNFGFAEGGFGVAMSVTPMRSVADMKAQKVWVPEGDPVSYSMMQALGVSPTTLPLTDVLTGLQTGLINAVGASPLGAVAFQWHTKVRYITEVPLVFLAGVFTIDKKVFGRLEAADQAVVREVFTATFRKLNAQNRKDNQSARAAMA
jgi:TRAP-type C4-dicarboxylate transport system substrate-binding protein